MSEISTKLQANAQDFYVISEYKTIDERLELTEFSYSRMGVK